MTGYLDYTDRPWRLELPTRRSSWRAGSRLTGGIPVVTEPDGALMWDSTTIIEHLDLRTDADRRTARRSDDAVPRPLARRLQRRVVLRPAVGSRWNYEGNTEAAGWQITEELSTIVGFLVD